MLASLVESGAGTGSHSDGLPCLQPAPPPPQRPGVLPVRHHPKVNRGGGSSREDLKSSEGREEKGVKREKLLFFIFIFFLGSYFLIAHYLGVTVGIEPAT